MPEYTVEFVGTGETITVSDTQTILRACLDAGIAQEYSCRVGMCLACSAEILEGEVVQPAAHALTEAEHVPTEHRGRTRRGVRGTRR